MDETTRTVSHLAGPAITFGAQVRQRCVWCGFVIEDTDLARVAIQVDEDGSVPPWISFAEGRFLRITTDRGFSCKADVADAELASEEEDSVRVPDDCCMRLPAQLTLEVEGAGAL